VADQRETSTNRYTMSPVGEETMKIKQSCLDQNSKEAMVTMAKNIDKMSVLLAKINFRLQEQERWTAMQQGVVGKICWVIGLAVLGSVGAAMLWAFDASRGLK